jgi:hypothetical protein
MIGIKDKPVDGFRNKKNTTLAQDVRELQTMLTNTQQAIQIQQMMVQKTMKDLSRLDQDMHNAMGLLNDLQYRTLAVIEEGKYDISSLEQTAETIKLKDYNSASDKEDLEKGYTPCDIVKEDNVVIITSECQKDPSRSIFRSKFNMKDVSVADIIKKFPGLHVGDKVDANINGFDHVIEILGIRNVPVKVEEPAQTVQ